MKNHTTERFGNLPGLALLALLALGGQAPAQFNSTMLLKDTPTADVLPAGSLAISADMTWPVGRTPSNYPATEFNGNVRFSPVKRLDFAVTAYTLKDYVLDARYQLVGGELGRFALAVGVYDVGIHNYVSPIGHDTADAWPDWQYWSRKGGKYIRTYENFSAFVVTNISVMDFARFHFGLGRGRFVGYDGPNAYMNTDIFFTDHHQWAISVFGGVEVYFLPQVALVLEANSRDANAGIKANIGPVTATLALNKVEGLVFATGRNRFGRGALSVSYQLDRRSPSQRTEPEVPSEPFRTEPAPKPEPPVAAQNPASIRLDPILFDWDKSDLTARAEATLRENAKMLLAHPDANIVITGYASEEGSREHNYPLSGRRANAALQYLESLGVPSRQMRLRALGESAGIPLPLHRSVYFEIESGK